MRKLVFIAATLWFTLVSLPSSAAIVKGNPQGAITVIEFFDYQCPHCRKLYDKIELAAKKNNDVKLVVRAVPLLGRESWIAARAAYAAREQGKYTPFNHELMQVHGRLNQSRVMDIASDIGLNISKLKTDMFSDKITNELNANRRASDSYRVSGVPVVIVKRTDGKGAPQRLVGNISYYKLEQAIDSLR